MKQRAYTIRTLEYDRLEDLDPGQQELLRAAMDAASGAYAPYSSFKVGTALRLDNDELITGNNQENVAYPSGLCAERVALFYAGARYPDSAVVSLAIAALEDGDFQEEPVAPCGACRQVLYQSEVRGGSPMEILLYGKRRITVLRSATDLLPMPFAFQTRD